MFRMKTESLPMFSKTNNSSLYALTQTKFHASNIRYCAYYVLSTIQNSTNYSLIHSKYIFIELQQFTCSEGVPLKKHSISLTLVLTFGRQVSPSSRVKGP